MTKAEHAVQMFSRRYSCAQAVLMAFAGDYGMDALTASKVACAFGGGMSHLGLTCGAVTGVLIVVGLKYGGDPETKARTYRAAREFVERFTSLHGSISCTTLTGYNLGDPLQLEKAREQGIFPTRCAGYVESAVKILEVLP